MSPQPRASNHFEPRIFLLLHVLRYSPSVYRQDNRKNRANRYRRHNCRVLAEIEARLASDRDLRHLSRFRFGVRSSSTDPGRTALDAYNKWLIYVRSGVGSKAFPEVELTVPTRFSNIESAVEAIRR